MQTPGAPGTCPFIIDRPVMRQRWERLTFLHWPFQAADVQRLLPDGLEAETCDGAAWVGLVPFYMRVATPGGRRVPWVSNFCETNVRTYVRDRAGRSGIWFFSLDASRLGVVVTARAGPYRLPYFWSSMRLADRAGALPDRPLDAVQRHRPPRGLRPRLPPALAPASRPSPGRGRPPAHCGRPARPRGRAAGALLARRRRRHRPPRTLLTRTAPTATPCHFLRGPPARWESCPPGPTGPIRVLFAHLLERTSFYRG